MPNRYTAAARRAANLTNKQLSEQIARLSPMSEEKIRELLPRKRDRAAFVALMAQVESETQQDTQLTYLRDNLSTAGVAALKVLKYFV